MRYQLLLLLMLSSCGRIDNEEEARSLCPKPDITAYELALMITNANIKPSLFYKKHPELFKHTADFGKCAE